MKKSNIILIIMFLLSIASYSQNKFNKITLEEIYINKKFTEHTVSGLRSMIDGEYFTTLEKNRKIVKYSYKTGKVIDILYSTIDPNFKIEDYEFSSDESKLLLAVNAKYVYRRSYTADYYIYDIATKELEKLSTKGQQKFATFSPNTLKVALLETTTFS